MNGWKWFKEKALRPILLVFLIAVLYAWGTQARSDDLTFEVGNQYLLGPAPAALVGIVYPGPGDAEIEVGALLVGGSPDHRGVMGVQALLVDGFDRLDLGLGVAYMNREFEQLGTQMNFSLMLRWRFNRGWYAALRHWSNASTTDENTGLDLITIGRRF